MIHKVTIEPTHINKQRQFYKATYDNEVIVSQSWDPEFAACRALLKRGLVGSVHFFRAGNPNPSLIVHDLERAAGYRSYETDRVGPALKKWRPYTKPASRAKASHAETLRVPH